ncbi:ExeM/NucH family extracellular endonuclease [Shewanella cyperi]|uniref:ExeM/NucH family extracellular endonuclease n=1 Tax=Shewanella cyperi TaxID=2814292 RepID=UPI001A93D053|nr:ExeM/NucH family extracellular endonuclease [Shewanella cyperi]QSX42179.1 ExeM/NucH family extracellular endonuclease [Shewanella cyperi]
MRSRASWLALALGSASSLAQAADTLIISEYVEGSGYNKAIELYNPTATAVDLSQYELKFFFNGSQTAGTTIALEGTLAAGGTYVVADNDASAELLAKAQLLSTAAFFNGDDAIVLLHNGQAVDSLGQVGVDPGTEWGTGELSTADNTLRRKADQLLGDSQIDDAMSFDSWQGFAKDDISDLGLFAAQPPVPENPPAAMQCGSDATAIHALQGNTNTSPLNGQIVEVEAVVTSNQEAGLKGLFLQMADAEADSDPATSEGVFLYTGNAPSGYLAGERIRVKAKVTEYQGLTELTSVAEHKLCANNQALPSAALVSLPLADSADLEAVEGMRVTFSQNLVVNEVYNLGRYGEVTLGSQRHFMGTQVAAPGADALAVTAANKLDSILLDDGLTAQNPDPVRYPSPGLSASNSLRVGDTVTGLNAVMHYGFGVYRLMPVDTVNIVASNPRLSAPELALGGNLKVASFNVLNFFNGDGMGGGFPTARGANTLSEFERQKAKIVSAMVAIDADIFGLMEIENDGYGAESAIAELVASLNAAIGEPRYQYIQPGSNGIGTDAISVGMIYRADRVTPQGAAKVLSSANSALDDAGQPLFNDGKNRPMLAQGFSHNDSGEPLVVAVNHFKSKGSDCVAEGDPDLNDGQGNCNLTRSRAARAVGAFLGSEFADAPVLVIGDLNSYAKEDPLTELANAGLTELFAHLAKENAYSYVFSGESGQLDHALASAALLDKVVDVTEWHINTDEPRILDYNEEFKTQTQLQSLYAPDAFRSSDHDPVVISLLLEAPNQAPVADFSVSVDGGNVSLQSLATDVDGTLVSHVWDLGDGTQAQGDSVSHAYAKSGDYQVTLTVTDDDGLSHSLTKTVSVTVQGVAHKPVARIVHFDLWFWDLFVSDSYDEDGVIRKQHWQFSDKRQGGGNFVLRRKDGRANSVTLTVTDNDKLSDSTSLSF